MTCTGRQHQTQKASKVSKHHRFRVTLGGVLASAACSFCFLVISLFQISGQPGQTLNKAGHHRQAQGIITTFHQFLHVLSVQLERTTPNGHHRKLPSSCASQAPKLAPNLINSSHLWRLRLEGNLQDRSTTLRHFLHHVDCSTCLPKDLDTTLQLVCTCGDIH